MVETYRKLREALPWGPVLAAILAAGALWTFVAAREIGPLPGWAVAGLFLALGGGWAAAGGRVERPGWFDWADRDPFEGRLRWLTIGLWYAVRLPLLFVGGYSGDLDSWRVAVVARRVLEQGSYQPSRWPGYPLVEIGLAPFVTLGGPIAANLLTATVGLLGLYLLDRLGRRLGLRSMGLVTLAALLAAPVVLNTASTVDYPYAYTALTGAVLAATHRRWALAGLLLGVATGCRIPTGTFGLPLLFLAARDPAPGRALRDLCGSTAATVVVALSPLWAQYGAGFLHAYDQHTTASVAALRVVWGLGTLTLVCSAPALVDAALGRGPAPLETEAGRHRSDGLLLALFWMVIGWFILLPMQSSYLYPLVPFGLLVAARWTRPAAIAALAVGMAVANVWDLRAGMVPLELRSRADDLAPSEAISALELPEGGLLIVGVSYPVVRAMHPDWEVVPAKAWRDELLRDPERDLTVALSTGEAELEAHLDGGGAVYFFDDDVLKDWKKKNKADPLALGATVLTAEQRGDVSTPHRADEDVEGPRRKGGKKAGKNNGKKSDGAPVSDEPARWVSSNPAATNLKETEGRVVIEVKRADDRPVEVCLEPAIGAGDGLRARTRWKIKTLEPSGEVSLHAVWIADGAEISRERLSAVTAASPDADVNEAINAPEGADAVKPCVRIDADRAIAILSRTRIKRASDDKP